MGREVKILFKDEMRTVGRLSDDGSTFIKYVGPSHLCRKYNGFGINYEVFKSKVEAGDVDNIKVVYDRENGGNDTLVASVGTWMDKGVVDQLGGFPEQIFLAIDDFDSRT